MGQDSEEMLMDSHDSRVKLLVSNVDLLRVLTAFSFISQPFRNTILILVQRLSSLFLFTLPTSLTHPPSPSLFTQEQSRSGGQPLAFPIGPSSQRLEHWHCQLFSPTTHYSCRRYHTAVRIHIYIPHSFLTSVVLRMSAHEILNDDVTVQSWTGM